MGVVYRYTDLNDNRIKYVGIVWSGNRTLKQRVEEHYKNDSWCDKGHWKIEYVLREINTRTDAEYLEAHYTNKFRDPEYEWFGKTKLNWGESELIDDTKDEWKIFSTDEETQSNFKTEAIIDATKLVNDGLEGLFAFRIKDSNTGFCIRELTTVNIKDNNDNAEYMIPGDVLLETILDQEENIKQLIKKDETVYKNIEILIKESQLKIDILKSEIDGNITDVYFFKKYHFTVYDNNANILEFNIDNDSTKQFIIDNEIPIYKQLTEIKHKEYVF